jgi:hypothetical protein
MQPTFAVLSRENAMAHQHKLEATFLTTYRLALGWLRMDWILDTECVLFCR